VAASAIIPIFAFPGWQYPNLHEVLLYPDTFDEQFDFSKATPDRQVLGMVGSGAMNHVMILSKPSLHAGFVNKTDKQNTAVHEFVHLIDKTDGTIDGIPELLLDKAYVKPWLRLIHENISNIQRNESDINPYAATNEAEFFAVVAEYFFERPLLLKERHPDLYALLESVFRQEPATDGGNNQEP
jgi:Mlc titration factor MtfA (ptsG expression regulator)